MSYMKIDDYVLRSLSKIKHKRWELFVISRIINKLIDEAYDVEFVCQQLVRRSDGKLALLDLFFPQFGIFLEIDEPQHASEKHSENDRTRTDEILRVAGLKEKRITVFQSDNKTIKPLIMVATEVDDFIRYILNLREQAKREGSFDAWDFEARYDPQRHLDLGSISVANNPVFRKQHEALRCFGYKKGPYQRGIWTLSDDPKRAVWFPRLYQTKEWDNELSDDGKIIVEQKTEVDGVRGKITYELKDQTRIVCARYHDNLGAVLYRFLGEFEFDPSQSDDFRRVFVRKADEIDTIA